MYSISLCQRLFLVELYPSLDSKLGVEVTCKIKDKLKLSEWFQYVNYSIKQDYEYLQGPNNNMHWPIAVWNRLSLPKHRFIEWLAYLGKLQTRDRLSGERM